VAGSGLCIAKHPNFSFWKHRLKENPEDITVSGQDSTAGTPEHPSHVCQTHTTSRNHQRVTPRPTASLKASTAVQLQIDDVVSIQVVSDVSADPAASIFRTEE
jgi:hypothetical protein